MTEHRPSIALRIAWTAADIWPAGVQVLLALASCGDYDTGRNCRPKVDTIVNRSSLSRATVTRTLARLRTTRWILPTAARHRRPTTYDINVARLASVAPKEQQVSLTTLFAAPDVEAQNEPQAELEAQNEPLNYGEGNLEAQNEPPPNKDHVRTHTLRAREDAPSTPAPDLALLGHAPPPRCAHPYRHAWCAGRVHVPRDLHFELLDRLGTRIGETRAEKAGRLVAFYADTMTHLPPDADISNAYAFWNAAYQAWVGTGARQRGESRRRDGVVSSSVCAHAPMCETRHACIDRTLAEAREERQRKSG